VGSVARTKGAGKAAANAVLGHGQKLYGRGRNEAREEETGVNVAKVKK
jgi:hypothetical protein